MISGIFSTTIFGYFATQRTHQPPPKGSTVNIYVKVRDQNTGPLGDKAVQPHAELGLHGDLELLSGEARW